MGRRLTGTNPLAYRGVRPGTPPNMVINTRNPTTRDYIEFEIGDFWVVPKKAAGAPASDPSSIIWILVSKRENIGIWKRFRGGGGGGSVAIKRTVYTTGSGTHTFHESMVECLVECVGGGGGSGAIPIDNSGTPNPIVSVAGGSGGYVSKIYTVDDVGTDQPYSVGAAGAAGPIALNGDKGGNGGDTTFASGSLLLTAGGGSGGDPGKYFQTIATGGVATGGDVNIPGQAPCNAHHSNQSTFDQAFSGTGTMYGNAPMFTGEQAPGNVNLTFLGISGTGYGTGGGPTIQYNTSATYPDPDAIGAPGAAGTGGIIIITEYLS